ELADAAGFEGLGEVDQALHVVFDSAEIGQRRSGQGGDRRDMHVGGKAGARPGEVVVVPCLGGGAWKTNCRRILSLCHLDTSSLVQPTCRGSAVTVLDTCQWAKWAVCAYAGRGGSVRGSPNRGSRPVSKRVMADMRSPASVSTSSPTPCRIGAFGS